MTGTEPYDLQRLYAEKVGGPFSFTWADRVWVLPNLRMLDIELQDRVENLDASGGVQVINELFDELLGPEQGQAWRQTVRPIGAIWDLFQAWLDHSKAKPGESAASDGSSRSTGRPSKRTSSGSTGSASPKRSTPRARKSATARGNSSSASAG